MAADAQTYGAVSSLLWREREVLENLLYVLTTEKLIVSSGSSRFLPRATAEVEAAAERMRLQEVVRAAEVEELARQLGLPGDTTLGQLAETAEEPWAMLFAEHRTALRDLVLEVQAVAADVCRDLAAAGRAISETLDRLGLTSSTYDSRGGLSVVPTGPRLLDERG